MSDLTGHIVMDYPVPIIKQPATGRIVRGIPRKRIPGLPASPPSEPRAQQHDIAEEGHDYWVHGKGLAKWADTDDPWTELHAHLVKFMPDGEAKRTAAEWFHEVFHFWPGSDANRVTHGHPPRGKKVGPG